ncbi:UNVERIFIED_CONTAM: Pancreatic progenitor cell differentiation and proliferation factor-like protein, partial [Eudyptes pachyrhynchus]
MASVPSAGCLLAKNQYYRSKRSGGPGAARTRPGGLLWRRRLMVWALSPFAGLPELIDKCWWIKSFFHSEPSPPTVGRKTLSAS